KVEGDLMFGVWWFSGAWCLDLGAFRGADIDWAMALLKRNVPAGVFTIRGAMGVCHVLVGERGEAVLLDAGLIGEQWQIRWRLRRLGLGPENVKAILLTHGHLDHVGNLAWAKAWTGAPVLAHRWEQAHIDGVYPYS